MADMKPSSAVPDAKWTVMVFMGAATVAGDQPLTAFAEADLKEMRFIGSGKAGYDGELNVYVQVHQGGDIPPRRGRITDEIPAGIDGLEAVPGELTNLARGMALQHFIRWALEDGTKDLKPRQPHYSMLVLWGHAYDFAIGRTPTTEGTVDALDFAELSRVLERLQFELGMPDRKLDILGFDACDIATVEMACQLEPFAKYLLGSQIGVPLPGWPYDRILDRIRNPHGRVMGPPELGSYIVRRFCESYSAEARTVSLTLLDLNRAQGLLDVMKLFALILATAIGNASNRQRIASLFIQSQTAPGKPYVDVADLCLTLARRCGNPLVVEAARTAGDFLIGPQPVCVGESQVGAGRPFVVDHGRNTGRTARLNGLSIYAPHVAPGRDFDAVRHLYQNFLFAQETQWSGLVHALAKRD
jgi:Clostripain family